MQDSPIGIFDSGLGGLTVFKEIARLLPQENLIYLGDTARVPYGNKSAATVTRYALQNVRFLLDQGVKLVVVACNTASAFALEELKRNFNLPIVGVIEPGAKGALKVSRNRRIGVIGTEGTVRSEAYTRALKNLKPDVFVTSAACPLFVPLVEEGWWDEDVSQLVAKKYLSKMIDQQIDTLILGCTHYPLLKNTLQKTIGSGVALIDSAEETAREASSVLGEKDLLNPQNKNPRRDFFVTDSPERFLRVGGLFLEKVENVRHVSIDS